jgi:hypothetical protein
MMPVAAAQSVQVAAQARAVVPQVAAVQVRAAEPVVVAIRMPEAAAEVLAALQVAVRRALLAARALAAAKPVPQALAWWSLVRRVSPPGPESRAVNQFSSFVPPVKHGKSGDNPPALHEQSAGKNAVLWLER